MPTQWPEPLRSQAMLLTGKVCPVHDWPPFVESTPLARQRVADAHVNPPLNDGPDATEAAVQCRPPSTDRHAAPVLPTNGAPTATQSVAVGQVTALAMPLIGVVACAQLVPPSLDTRCRRQPEAHSDAARIARGGDGIEGTTGHRMKRRRSCCACDGCAHRNRNAAAHNHRCDATDPRDTCNE